ncbi:MAG: hypothetical protein IPL80_14135 [Sterolibacteriaceae bacterium]|jgi:hypothetical protein|nr:hypothetical protein [Sterolibacteriaceae bacterium]
MQIQARGVLDRAGETLEAGKIRREVGIEVRERGSDQRGNAIRVFELTSYSSTPRETICCIISDDDRKRLKFNLTK